MCDGNYIKLNRGLLGWKWEQDANTLSVWIHILLMANWKDGFFMGVPIPRGSLAISQEALQKATGLTRQCVRTSLNRLKSTNEITIKTYPKFSVITVVKYSEYQDANQVTNQQLTINQPTANHNRRKKERKEVKNNIRTFSDQRSYDFDDLENRILRG